MAADWEILEREFEELLIEVLTQDHDLDVRRWGDPLDRRRASVGTLLFDYRNRQQSSTATVVVTLEDVSGFSTLLHIDFSSEGSMRAGAEDCEALALFLSEYLDERREQVLPESPERGQELDRRDEDLG